jgi:hypothetical protein
VSEASWAGPSADPVHVMFTLRESSLFFLHRLLVRSLIANLHKVYVEDASGASSVLRLVQPRHGGQRHCALRNLPWSRRRFGDQSPKGGVVCAGEWELSEVEQSEVCRDDYSISRADGGWCWNEKSLPTSMYFGSLSGLGAFPTFLLTNTEQSPPFNNQHCL